MKTNETLIDEVIEQIKQDMADGDIGALAELLTFVPNKNLQAYLPVKFVKGI